PRTSFSARSTADASRDPADDERSRRQRTSPQRSTQRKPAMSAAPNPQRLLSDAAYARIDRELAKYPADQRQSAVMAALAIAQREQGWVTPEVVRDIAAYIGMPPIAVHEVATFYNMYDTRPVGKHKLSVCTNLPCALRDGVKAGEYLKEKLGIDFNETTP